MDKMRMESVDMTAQNIEKIGALFPNCITETVDENGKAKKAINFELLKQMLSGDVIEGSEAYEFTWVGKKAAIVEANKPIRKTLRPCKEESVNWDTTENLYIEGDNLEVLKLLQESYLGAIKMIYIDPPYNTGNDKFVYPDDYSMSKEDFEEEIGLFDEDDNKLFCENNSSNPRFHSVWCSMIYSRFLLARNLLADDGVIFISIDNNEFGNMKAICNEVFGEDNFISILGVENNPKGRKNNAFVAESFEYCLIYAKNKAYIYQWMQSKSRKKFFAGMESDSDKRQTFTDEYGEFKQSKRQVSGCNKSNALCKDSKAERCFTIYYKTSPEQMVLLDEYERNSDAWILSEKGKQLLSEGFTRYCCTNNITNKPSIPLYSKETLYKLFSEHSLYFKDDGTIYEKDRDNEQQITSFLSNKKFGLDLMTESATAKMEHLFGVKGIFTNSKAIDFIKALIKLYPASDTIVLDFFSGSSTTAHAVMQLNAEDGGTRKYIMVQIPEKCAEDSEAYKAGYETICEIGKERIRRATKKIREENPLTTQNLDTGFRVLKLDDTNMNEVYYAAGDYTQDLLSMLESNVKTDRTDLDLLFGCLLEWGLPLSLPYTSEQIEGCTVHTYNDGDLIACFDENIPDSVIKTIAKKQPLRAVFRDSSFANSPSKINVGEVFKLLAPDTRVKVL